MLVMASNDMLLSTTARSFQTPIREKQLISHVITRPSSPVIFEGGGKGRTSTGTGHNVGGGAVCEALHIVGVLSAINRRENYEKDLNSCDAVGEGHWVGWAREDARGTMPELDGRVRRRCDHDPNIFNK